jgi:LysR family transcriptional regulator, benzoate and cis,cis-muconate-responsive activator of ben and cat genes
MELRHLRYFAAVAELENVSRAALRLHVSQPALSRQIRDLEEELGFPLLHRGARSVRLTEAGRAFHAEARAVLARAEEAVSRARAVATGRRGELSLGYAPVPTARLLARALRAFQSDRPEVRVRLHDLSTEEMLAGLRKRSLQLAFLVKPTPAMLRGLRFEELARDPVRLAVARGHPLAGSRSVRLGRLAAEPLVAFSRQDYPEYHEMLRELFAPIGGKPRIAEEHEGGAGLVAAVEAGCGAAVVPRSLGLSVGSRLRLVRVEPEPPPLVVGAAWSAEGLSAAAQRFLRGAREAGSAGSPASEL